jgi:hypothetical protein
MGGGARASVRSRRGGSCRTPLTAGVWEGLPEATRLMVVRALGILLVRRAVAVAAPGEMGAGGGDGDARSGRPLVDG